ncbi:MAG: hypothetical protein EOS83_23175 [Mesorhizobium sp.]|nr:MAG: hypothetical protein EOS83_23175 [Mesorhizobium sp.]
MRGVPVWHRQSSVQQPSSVSALRADPPSPTRGEGKVARGARRCRTSGKPARAKIHWLRSAAK